MISDTYKLCDFGSLLTETVKYDSLDLNQKKEFEKYIENNSTAIYRSPEMVDPCGKVVGAAADMWMLGCIAYVLAFGKYPFEGDHVDADIKNCSIEYEHEGELTDLIKWMLSVNPEDRPSSKKLLSILNEKITSSTDC